MKTTTVTLLFLLGLLFSGCSSKSNFYQLHPRASGNNPAYQSKKGVVIGIAAVEVPEYLKKSEIVTRMGKGRIAVHETDLWAGSFAENIQSVLHHNIAARLPRYTFLSHPWEEPVNDTFRLYVTIDRFDTDTNGNAVLDGRWSLVDREKNSVRYSESLHYTAEGGKSLDEMVETQSRLLDRLSRRIAGKITAKI